MPGGGIEPPTRGFSVKGLNRAISHYFQSFRYQVVTVTELDYVGLFLTIFDRGSYKRVTVITPIKAPCLRIEGRLCFFRQALYMSARSMNVDTEKRGSQAPREGVFELKSVEQS
jgi:hypothetical protein